MLPASHAAGGPAAAEKGLPCNSKRLRGVTNRAIGMPALYTLRSSAGTFSEGHAGICLRCAPSSLCAGLPVELGRCQLYPQPLQARKARQDAAEGRGLLGHEVFIVLRLPRLHAKELSPASRTWMKGVTCNSLQCLDMHAQQETSSAQKANVNLARLDAQVKLSQVLHVPQRIRKLPACDLHAEGTTCIDWCEQYAEGITALDLQSEKSA